MSNLGSSNYITNIAGEVSQHTEYFAFGETFVEEHKGSNNSPYKFNGKELDAESGLYYYGARYYDPRISIWASVDPLAEKYPGISSYVYCLNNPLCLVDPDGQDPIEAIKKFNAFTNGTFNRAWKESFINNGEKVQEITFMVIRDAKGIMHVRGREIIGSGGGQGKPISLNVGDKVIGQGHTHPYSISEGSHQGIPFSATDIFGVKGQDKDYISMVDAGTKRFALIIEDKKKANAFFKGKSMSDINEVFNSNLTNAEGTFEEKAKTAIINTLGENSGIGFYESTDKKDFSKVKLPEKKVEATPPPTKLAKD